MKTIGERIKERRHTLGMSVDDLAKAIGKSRATVYRYESGDIEDPPAAIINDLAKALHTTPEYLTGWQNVDVLITYKEKPVSAEEKARLHWRSSRLAMAEKILDDGAEVIFDAYDRAPDKLTDYARMICLTTGDTRHLATAAHSSADRVPQEDLDLLDDD